MSRQGMRGVHLPKRRGGWTLLFQHQHLISEVLLPPTPFFGGERERERAGGAGNCTPPYLVSRLPHSFPWMDTPWKFFAIFKRTPPSPIFFAWFFHLLFYFMDVSVHFLSYFVLFSFCLLFELEFHTIYTVTHY